MRRFLEVLRKLDWPLMATVFIVASIGLVLIYSTTSTEDVLWSLEFKKQLIAFGLGIVAVLVLATIDYSVFRNYAYFIYGASISLLVGVLLFGQEVRGTRGWFDLGFFQFQPSEIMKVAIIIILARYFASIAGRKSRFQFVVVSGVITFIPVVLVMLQPDFGAAVIYILIWLGFLLFSDLKRNYVLILAVSGVLVSWISWLVVLRPYQKERVKTFLNPNADPLGAGYNIIQSKIAIGSGGFFGRGLGQGSQSQLQFLPERHTDFIFAVLAEELGLFGSILLLSMFFIMFGRMMVIGKLSRDEYGIMFVIGAVILFVVQVFINIGTNLGLLPVTGITLSLVSYGGSSLVTMMIVFGILQSVKVRGRDLREEGV